MQYVEHCGLYLWNSEISISSCKDFGLIWYLQAKPIRLVYPGVWVDQMTSTAVNNLSQGYWWHNVIVKK